VLSESVARVGDTSEAAIQQIDQAFGEFHEHAMRINTSTAATADAMSHMLAALESATQSIRRFDESLQPASQPGPDGEPPR
jgi:methyl-accepting chemotaxis protein